MNISAASLHSPRLHIGIQFPRANLPAFHLACPPKHTDTPVCTQASQVSKLYLGWGVCLASQAHATKSSAAAKLVGVKSHGSQGL